MSATLALAAGDDGLGRLVARVGVGAHSEGLRLAVQAGGATSVTVTLSPG